MKARRIFRLKILNSFLFFICSLGFASEFNPSLILNGKEIYLRGVGTRTSTIFNIKVYTAGFYYSDKIKLPSLKEELLPFLFKLEFKRSVSVDKFQAALEEGLERNNYKKDDFKLELDKIKNYLSEFQENDELIISYDGTLISLKKGNADSAVEFTNKDFSYAIYSVWLGNPIQEKLKNDLLSIKK